MRRMQVVLNTYFSPLPHFGHYAPQLLFLTKTYFSWNSQLVTIFALLE
jgi:hypothetical protein